MEAGLPFSEAVRVNDTLYLSGEVGRKPFATEVVPGGIEAEARQIMENISSLLEANGLGLKNVVKCTVMLADIAEWPAFNAVYVEYFSAPYPARSAFAASGLALGASVEVECIAAYPD
ncbi:MAG: Rid family detoxifying hydrolase [Pseudomonadota bacterium]